MSFNKVIKSEDTMKMTQLLENKEFFVKRNEYMQSVNDYYKQNGTVVGFPGIEAETAHNLDARVSESQPVPYPQSFFDENQAQITRLEAMVETVVHNPKTLFKGWQFEGGEAVVNLANNRLQLMFDEKPTDEQINSLKRFGFHWAKTAKAWQRPLTSKVFAACDKIDFIKPENGKKPSEMQPKQPKKSEPER